MAMNTSVFMHDSDKAALQALKSIPGFAPLLKGFMSVWNERQYQLSIAIFNNTAESTLTFEKK